MCGRFTLAASPEDIARLFDLASIESFPPRYNIAPTQPILLVLGGREARPETALDGRHAMLARWGLIPSWLRDTRGFPLLFNARSETVATKNAFRAALRHRRCLVPASGFYEWRKEGRKSRPYLVKPVSGRPFAFAGLMETAHGADGGEVDTATILTTAASADLAAIHERMPLVVEEGDYERWLDCRTFEPREVGDLLSPRRAGFFEAVEIDDRVNKAAYTAPDLQAPSRPAGEASSPGARRPGTVARAPSAQGSLFDD